MANLKQTHSMPSLALSRATSAGSEGTGGSPTLQYRIKHLLSQDQDEKKPFAHHYAAGQSPFPGLQRRSAMPTFIACVYFCLYSLIFQYNKPLFSPMPPFSSVHAESAVLLNDCSGHDQGGAGQGT
jgi:hypothetical protein